ncbi:MAG TPA: family 78 glycoside hydrolase catalytic domain, partial [Tichowtungia sp.]|nr:family 78 glycoside hydrolase catalytic domain [Tichowtungia sp.]
AKINVPAKKDQALSIRFAEMLNPDGTMYTDNYRTAKSTDTYIPAETGFIEWHPVFTFHGFQYVELSGMPEGVKPQKSWVKGMVLHSDLSRIGTFESSNKKLTRLQKNIIWGQRGNFLDVPTDCPQRDERLGWTGDAQVFCPTSMFNYNCHAFWKSWLTTMRHDQFKDGRIPHVIPDITWSGGSPGWMDAATCIPWDVYVRTGDTNVLADNYEMMERLVGWYRSQSKDHLTPEIGGYGDWLQPYAQETKGDTPRPLLGSIFYARSTQILADSAKVLGRMTDADKYSREADTIKKAFDKHYFDEDGKLQNAPETQTAYLLAIAFNLIPDAMKEKATDHLVRLIDEAGGHLRTGFLGTPYITRVLDEMGHSDLALSILFKETYPSWFYSINQGATTMWERWNSYSRAEGFNGASMNSLNHYAYGAIGQWIYERLAGLAPDPAHPGYKHFFIRPLIAPQLDHARAELETPYGTASSGWTREDGKVVIEAIVPPNTTATVLFPDGRKPQQLDSGTYRFELD